MARETVNRKLIENIYNEQRELFQSFESKVSRALNSRKAEIIDFLCKNNVPFNNFNILRVNIYIEMLKELGHLFLEGQLNKEKSEQWLNTYMDAYDKVNSNPDKDKIYASTPTVKSLLKTKQSIDDKLLLTIDDVSQLIESSQHSSKVVRANNPYGLVLDESGQLLEIELDIQDIKQKISNNPEILLIPLCDGEHWVYLLWKDNKWILYDSLSGDEKNKDRCDAIKTKAQMLLKLIGQDPSLLIYKATGAQKNDYECSSFVVRAYRTLTNDPSKNSTHIEFISEVLYLELIRENNNNDSTLDKVGINQRIFKKNCALIYNQALADEKRLSLSEDWLVNNQDWLKDKWANVFKKENPPKANPKKSYLNWLWGIPLAVIFIAVSKTLLNTPPTEPTETLLPLTPNSLEDIKQPFDKKIDDFVMKESNLATYGLYLGLPLLLSVLYKMFNLNKKNTDISIENTHQNSGLWFAGSELLGEPKPSDFLEKPPEAAIDKPEEGQSTSPEIPADKPEDIALIPVEENTPVLVAISNYQHQIQKYLIEFNPVTDMPLNDHSAFQKQLDKHYLRCKHLIEDFLKQDVTSQSLLAFEKDFITALNKAITDLNTEDLSPKEQKKYKGFIQKIIDFCTFVKSLISSLWHKLFVKENPLNTNPTLFNKKQAKEFIYNKISSINKERELMYEKLSGLLEKNDNNKFTINKSPC